jgi:hypothetical protein
VAYAANSDAISASVTAPNGRLFFFSMSLFRNSSSQSGQTISRVASSAIWYRVRNQVTSSDSRSSTVSDVDPICPAPFCTEKAGIGSDWACT